MKSNVIKLLLFKILVVSALQSSATQITQVDFRVLGPGGQVIVYFFDTTSNSVVLRDCGKEYPIVQKREDCTGKEKRFTRDEFKEVARQAFVKIVDSVVLDPIRKDDLASFRKKTKDNSAAEEAEIAQLQALVVRIKHYLSLGAGDFAQEAYEKALLDIAQTEAQLALSKNYASAERIINTYIDDLLETYIVPETFNQTADGIDGGTAKFNILYFIFTQVFDV